MRTVHNRKSAPRWPAAMVLVVATAVVVAAGKEDAGEPSALEILKRTMAIHDQVRDYTCRITVDLDFPNVRMPKRTFTVYFKKPDKIRIDSQGQLVILPKDILLPGRLSKHVREGAKVVLAGKSVVDGRPVYCIKIIPQKQNRPERIMLWIWGDTWTFKRTVFMRGANPVMTADWQHIRVGDFWMPSKVVCEVTGGEVAHEGKGTITIEFSQWRVNSGLSDDIFKQADASRPNRQ